MDNFICGIFVTLALIGGTLLIAGTCTEPDRVKASTRCEERGGVLLAGTCIKKPFTEIDISDKK